MLRQWVQPRVVIYGYHCDSWTAAVGEGAPVWDLLPGVKSVCHLPAGKLHWASHRRPATVVVPLMEDHILSCPSRLASLIPDAATVSLLRDKKRFAEYAEQHRLSEYIPATVTESTRGAFPYLLKRASLNNGAGIVLVQSAQDLARRLQQDMWREQRYVLQEYVASPEEFATYFVFHQGELLWQRTFRQCAKSYTIRNSTVKKEAQRYNPPAEVLQQLLQFLKPLRYTGPCGVDYRIRQDGRIAVMEVNPRLGGSLMRKVFTTELASILRCIIRHALLNSRNPLCQYAAETHFPDNEE